MFAAFKRHLSFHLIEDNGRVAGFLPLSIVKETVDMGAVFNNTYTVMAGGPTRIFPVAPR